MILIKCEGVPGPGTVSEIKWDKGDAYPDYIKTPVYSAEITGPELDLLLEMMHDNSDLDREF